MPVALCSDGFAVLYSGLSKTPIVTIERLKSVIDIEGEFPGEDENAYNTVGGLAMYVLGRIPVVADTFEAAGFRFAGESNFYAQPDDPKTALVFDPPIRGKTDQFIYRFVKPK